MTTDETPTLKITPDVLAAARAQADEASETISSDTSPAAPTVASAQADAETMETAPAAPVDATEAPPSDTVETPTHEPSAPQGAENAATNGYTGDVADQASAASQPSQPNQSAQAGDPTDAVAAESDEANTPFASDPTLAQTPSDEATRDTDATSTEVASAADTSNTTEEALGVAGVTPDAATQADEATAGAVDEVAPQETPALEASSGGDAGTQAPTPDVEAAQPAAEAQEAPTQSPEATQSEATETAPAEAPTMETPGAAEAAVEAAAPAPETTNAAEAMVEVTETPAPATPPTTTDNAEATEAAEAAAAMNEANEVRDPDFMRYFATRIHFGNLAFSPDSSQIAYITNTSGQLNIWRQAVTGGWASQVTTFEEETARGVIWAPNGNIIGAADRAGSEQYDLFTIPAQGGVITYLTNNPNAQYQFSDESLSPDGRYLAYGGNDRISTDGDVLVRDMQTGEVRRLVANGRYNIPVNWSPDGRYLTVVDLRSNTDLHLWLVEAATGEMREVLPHAEPFFLAPGPWLPDSTGFYVITDRGREFKGIARYRLASGEIEWLVAPEWDVEQLALSADGQRLVWALNESGRSQLYLRDGDQVALRMSGLPVGVIEQLTLARDGQTLALRINASTAPAEIYIVTLGPIGALATPHLRRLTFGMLGGLTPSDLVEPESITYPTFDGREIPAWLYRPRTSDGQRAPLIVSIHGGPEAQERVEYRAFYQYLLSKGIGVLAPNIRGSSGYGLSYQKLIHRDWGGAELKDIQAAAEYARTLPWVDADRLGVYGGSFGGFATLSAVTRLPEYWAAAVDIVGPSNLLTFARNVPPTWRRMMTQWVGDPDDPSDAEMMRQRSPITYVEQVRAPLLVMQGANDPRVVKSESDQMVERLRELGRTVEYVVFPDEGHGFTKRSNTLRGYWLAAEFFTRWLG